MSNYSYKTGENYKVRLLSTTLIGNSCDPQAGECSASCLSRLGMVDATIYRRLHLQDIEERIRMQLLKEESDDMR